MIQALWVPRRDGSLSDLFTDAIGLFTVLLLWRKIRSGLRRARQ
ncbi:Uncharacterised protein [Mycobacteroides abscessus subsp. abscessus]|nr:Uncharacterised protein [Mycobacteroides abscessus subsp. abscessus]